MPVRLLDAAEAGQAEPVRKQAPSCKRPREQQEEPAVSGKQQRTSRRNKGAAASGRHSEGESEPERPDSAPRGRGRAGSRGMGTAPAPGRQAEASAEPEQPAGSGLGRGGRRGRGRAGSRGRGRGRGRGRAGSTPAPQSELAVSQLLEGGADAAQRPLPAESAALVSSAAGAAHQQPAEPAASIGATPAGLAGSQGDAGPLRLGQPSEAGAPGSVLLQAASAAAHQARAGPQAAQRRCCCLASLPPVGRLARRLPQLVLRHAALAMLLDCRLLLSLSRLPPQGRPRQVA